jgi:hypothetical protein
VRRLLELPEIASINKIQTEGKNILALGVGTAYVTAGVSSQ